MSHHRPFLEWPIEQLAEHAHKHAGHREVLAQLRHELTCRPGRDARALQRRLEASGESGAAVTQPWSADLGEIALRRRLAVATREVEELRRRMTSGLPVGAEARSETPHAALWLAPGAPEWLVLAARRAFRQHYHPDRHAGAARAAAEERFKASEEAFARILSEDEPEANFSETG